MKQESRIAEDLKAPIQSLSAIANILSSSQNATGDKLTYLSYSDEVAKNVIKIKDEIKILEIIDKDECRNTISLATRVIEHFIENKKEGESLIDNIEEEINNKVGVYYALYESYYDLYEHYNANLIYSSMFVISIIIIISKYSPDYNNLTDNEKEVLSLDGCYETIEYLKLEVQENNSTDIFRITIEQINKIEKYIKNVITNQNSTTHKKSVTLLCKDEDKESEGNIAENTALMVSTIAAILAGIFSQSIQKAMLNKILFGKAILFGYTLPAVNLAVASFVFGLLAFGAIFAILFTAKFIENPKKVLFHEWVSELNNNPSFKVLKPAIFAGICILIINAYSVALQILFFNSILLGGTAATNLAFAVISTTAIGLTLYVLRSINTSNRSRKHKGIPYSQITTLFSFIIGTVLASPITQTLFGASITGGPWLVVFSSLLVGVISATIMTFTIIAATKAQKNKYGFNLVIYAASFAILTLYASPIQIAILGNSLMFITPALSNISFGAIASMITTPILTKCYKAIETSITPNFIGSGQFSESATDLVSATISEFIQFFKSDDTQSRSGSERSFTTAATSNKTI